VDDLSISIGFTFQKWGSIKDPCTPSYVLGAQEDIPSLRNSTTSIASWSFLCGLWNYLAFKTLFTTTPAPSHSLFPCFVPK
jgi:hypothetical protein